jgi:glutamate 5-kinase
MPSTPIRQSVLVNAKRVVVKMGTQILTGPDGQLDVAFIRQMASQMAGLVARGIELTVVSSGAIGAGCAELGLKKRPRDVADQQAVAAVGQRRLMTHLHDAFAHHGLKVAQVLLTRSDFDDRTRFLNIRNCIGRIQAFGCIPILNENDTVAVDEIRFGDNDMLAALTCNALRADVMVLLSVIDGLLDDKGQRIDRVDDLAQAVGFDRQDKSKLGTGGMTTKLEAARLVTEAGEVAVIANGRMPDVLTKLFRGDAGVGTLFVPAMRKLDSRQRWIGLTARPAGTITVDDGAATAVLKGKSLLATGITEITGRFDRGEIVLLRDQRGREIARGLINYGSEEARMIMGKKSTQFEKLLGRQAFAEVVHCDNMVRTQAVE